MPEETIDPNIALDDGAVLFHRGIPIGRMEDQVLILNLGWTKIAGLGLKIQGDPDVDTKRGGVAFERLVHG